jgi:hypothetical protein
MVMSNKLQAGVGTASAAEVGKMQPSSFFLFMFREKLSQCPPAPQDYNVMFFP